jgi:hypothetical protein
VVQLEENVRLSYLSMQINVSDAGTTIDMAFYMKQLLEGMDVPERRSPGLKATFTV